jgi:hypothetical protein
MRFFCFVVMGKSGPGGRAALQGRVKDLRRTFLAPQAWRSPIPGLPACSVLQAGIGDARFMCGSGYSRSEAEHANSAPEARNELTQTGRSGYKCDRILSPGGAAHVP